MPINPLLNILAERTLIACDGAYFTNTVPIRPPDGDSEPSHLYIHDPLAPLYDQPYWNAYPPPFNYASITSGYLVDNEFTNLTTGFKLVAYKNAVTNDVILAFGGTDGTNATDWKSNISSYGWSQWAKAHDDVFAYLNQLPRENGELAVTVNFTGQSLGGALAQYAVYDWLKDSSHAKDASHFTLTTFNSLGGVYALSNPDNEPDGYRPSVLAGLSSAANFVVQGDIVSKLGGGFAAGPIYQLSFPPEQMNPITGKLYKDTLGPIDSHRIESGFYANLQSDGFSQAQIIDPASYILPSDSLAQPAALLGNLLNAKGPFIGSDLADLLAGLSAAAAVANPVQFDGLYKAVLVSLHDTGNMSDATYALLNGLRYPTNLIAKAIGVAATPITLIAAGLADTFSLGLTGIQKTFSGVQRFLGLSSHEVPSPPVTMSSHEYEMKTLVYLSSVPGSVPDSIPLAQELQSLNIDSDAFAQQLLTSDSGTWRTDTEAYLRTLLPVDQAAKTVRLADAFDRTLKMVPDLDPAVLIALDQERDDFIRQTAQGVANAIPSFTAKIPDTNYVFGTSLTFSDLIQINAGYAAELNDTELSAAARLEADQAKAILDRAGQTPIIQEGTRPNPFLTSGFDPNSVLPPTINIDEAAGKTLTLSLPFAAGAGGQQLALQLQGAAASSFRVISSSGELAPDSNGAFTLTIPEGQRQLAFSLFAQDRVTTNASLTLAATLVDQNGQPTHTSRLEATVDLTAMPSTNSYPTETVPFQTTADGYATTDGNDVAIYLQHHNYVIDGHAGDDLLLTRDGNDQLAGGAGNDALYGYAGDDDLSGGDGNDVLVADFRDDATLSPGSEGSLDGRDYLDGGAGNDVLGGGGGADVLWGGEGHDILWGDALVEGVDNNLRGTNGLMTVNAPGDDFLDGGDGSDELHGDGGNDTLFGGEGNDVLYGDGAYQVAPGQDFLAGGAGDDQLYGGGGHDVLDGGDGHDTLSGDQGDDVLEGGAGSDIYVYNSGDGHDAILDTPGQGDTNQILFGAGITREQLVLIQDQAAHTLSIQMGSGGTDIIDLLDFDLNGVNGTSVVQTLAFADGSRAALADLLPLPGGFVKGSSANDIIRTGLADDLVMAGGGDDILDAGAGNDILLGGTGNDILRGGAGNDVYVFNQGDGSDTIEDFAVSGEENTLSLGVGSESITLSVDNNDLVLHAGPGGDKVSLSFFSPNDAYGLHAVDRFQFADGTSLSYRELIDHGFDVIGTAGDDVLTGTNAPDRFRGGAGDDTYRVRNGNDQVIESSGEGTDTIETTVSYALPANVENLRGMVTDLIGEPGPERLIGNELNNEISGPEGFVSDNVLEGRGGDDRLLGYGGNDRLDGGRGDDTLEGGPGNDTYVFGRGSGHDIAFEQPFVGETNTIELTAGVVPSDVILNAYRDSLGLSLVLRLDGTSDELLLRSALDFDPLPFQSISFADGTIWGATTIESQIQGVTATASSDEGELLMGTRYGDVLIGRAGNDNLNGAEGADIMSGAEGNDSYEIDNPGDVVHELPGQGRDSVSSFINYTLPDNVEDLELVDSLHALVGIGNAEDNRLRGNAGSNLLVGGFGNDTLCGGTQDSFFGPDNDELDGGMGNDAYYVDSFDNGVDTIHDVALPGEGNRLQFGPSIRPSDLGFVRNSNSLFVSVGDQEGGLLLADFDPDQVSGSLVTETVEFSAGFDSFIAGYEVNLTTLLVPIVGSDSNDDMNGTAGSDFIQSGLGDDRLNGGPGNDVLSGGLGQDTYVFNAGGGFDLIDDLDTPGEENTVEFGPGILPADLHATYKGNGGGLVFRVGNGIDAIQLGVYTPDAVTDPRAVNRFHFADGSVRSLDELLQAGVDIQGTSGDDSLSGTFVNDEISGKEGNDSIYGGFGDDTLIGGPGNDDLMGGPGSDTYVFGPGDGIDRIFDGDGRGTTNKILFRPGITLDDLTLVTADDHFTITKLLVGTNGDAILLPNRIDGGPGFRTVSFADGLTVDLYVLFAAGQIPEDQIIFGGPDPSTLIGGTGNDTLVAGSGDTSMIGGPGNDTLRGGHGNSTFYGGGGNDVLVTGDGHNAFVFRIGSGIDTIQVTTNIPSGNSVLFGGSYSVYNPKLALGSLLIQYGDQGDEIHLEGFDPNDAYRNPGIETFQFADRSFTYQEFIDLGFDLQGTHDDDVITGTNAVDRIVGQDGNDQLSGGVGNDILTGGCGNDLLIGGAGDDTYVFNTGDGLDTIIDTATPGEGNRIQFGPGISRQDLVFTQIGSTLAIHVGTEGDAVQLNDFSLNGINGSVVTETLRFADGSAVALASLLGPVATDGDDIIETGAGDDVIDAKGGNDVVTTDAGNDIVTGGPGNDTLTGGPGDDTYMFQTGDGVDTIHDVAVPGEGNDLVFGPGILSTALSLGIDQNGLLLRIGNNGDAVHLSNFDPADPYGPHAIDTFRFADGTVLTYRRLIDRGFDLTGTAGDDTIVGTNAVDRITGLAGNDVLQAYGGDDVLDGGLGADTMIGGTGNDTYLVDDPGDDDPGDVVTEAANEGIDTVQSAISYRLTANVEKLTLTGPAPINATGNDLNNVLIGNSAANVLDGGPGADTLMAGGGDDLYLVDNADDVVIEEANDGTDTVQSSVSYTLAANVENLTLIGSASISGTGNGLDNLLIGNASANMLDGGEGSDAVSGGAGADTLLGGAGNDTLTGGVDADFLRGGDGDDVLQTSIDSLWTTGFAAKNVGSPGHGGTGQTVSLNNHVRSYDVLDGGAGTDLLLGTPGDDAIELDDPFSLFPGAPGPRLAGIEQIQTGDGNDIVDLTSTVYGYGDVTLDGGNGDDALWASAGNDVLLGGAGNDNLYGGAGADRLVGNDGNDTLDGGDGGDQLFGGSGNDTYIVDDLADVVSENANEGTDTVKSSISYVLGANVENLALTGTAAIRGTGNALNNTLTGNSAANVLAGGLGNDTYVVSDGDTVIELTNEGTDTVQSAVTWSLADNLENLTLTGSAAINGTGNTLNNTLTGNSAVNVLTGGAGDDTYVIGMGDTVVEQANEGIDTVKSAISWTLDANVENLALTGSDAVNGTGNSLNNVLTGNSAANVLAGGAGDDTYIVGAGDTVIEQANEGIDTVQSAVDFALGDNIENLTLTGTAINGTGNTSDNALTGNSAANVLTGGAGNDRLNGMSGADTLVGGRGDDTYIVDTAGDSVVEQVNEGTDTVQSTVTSTLAANVENLTLTGTNAISGTGNGLDNRLTGNTAANTLDGGAGADTLAGGLGNDLLKGGTGNDTYLFNRGEGQDKVSENDATSGNADLLLFGATINPLDLVLSRQANDLRLAIHGSMDQVTIQSWYLSTATQVETIQAGNGQQLLNSQVQQLIQAMAGFTQQTGLRWDQGIDQRPQDVQTILAANWH